MAAHDSPPDLDRILYDTKSNRLDDASPDDAGRRSSSIDSLSKAVQQELDMVPSEAPAATEEMTAAPTPAPAPAEATPGNTEGEAETAATVDIGPEAEEPEAEEAETDEPEDDEHEEDENEHEEDEDDDDEDEEHEEHEEDEEHEEHEEDDEHEEHEEDEEHESKPKGATPGDADADADETSAALTSLEAQVAALREKADALEHKDEIAEEDMVTLNITLHGMHQELEAACAKMKGTYDKALNRCQLDVTDSLSQVVRKVLTTKPKDKKAEDHQVSFAKHAPAVFYSLPDVRDSPTTVVLRRIFAVPTSSRARPWSRGLGYGRMMRMRPRGPYGRGAMMYPASPPPMYGYGYGYGAAAAPMMMPPPAAAYPMMMRQPCTMADCACGGGSGKPARRTPSRRRLKTRGTARGGGKQAAHTVVRQHRRRRGGGRASKQRGGGAGDGAAAACYQHEVCPNQQRYLYDAQGQQGCMQPLAQGGQRFVFPTAVVPVMAPSYYPATGPVGQVVA